MKHHKYVYYLPFFWRQWRIYLTNYRLKDRQDRDYKIDYSKIRLIKSFLLQRENGLCEMCQKEVNECTMELHHIIPISMNISLVYDINNAMCVCRKCHKMIHSNPIFYANQILTAIKERGLKYTKE